jgi:uncharacterized protein (DUF2164 family)
MSKRTPTWNTLSTKEQTVIHNALMAHFAVERDEQIGVIAAEEITNIVLDHAFAITYNKAIDAAIHTIEERHLDLITAVDLLKQG